MVSVRLSILFLMAILLGAAPSFGQEPDVTDEPEQPAAVEEMEGPPIPGEPLPPIYEEQLLRLSEILGSLSFLRDLCGESDGAMWRNEMSSLLAAEQPGPERRLRLVGRFNHGFETFNAVYHACTASARLAISRYLEEGQTLAADVRSRFGQ